MKAWFGGVEAIKSETSNYIIDHFCPGIKAGNVKDWPSFVLNRSSVHAFHFN